MSIIFRRLKLKDVTRTSVRTLILGIESSCDDSGAAIIEPKTKKVIAEALASQSSAKFGGVIPTYAMKNHAINVPKVVEQVLKSCPIEDIDAVAVTTHPGLKGSLVIGRNYAQYLCHKYQKPMIPIHHMEAHALTPRLTNVVEFPYLVFLISGGHCILAFAQDIDKFLVLGQSMHEAPGEMLDKVARQLELHTISEDYRHFSGGKAIESLAKNGNPTSHEFSEPLAHYRNCNFSFSGFKASILRRVKLLEEASSSEEEMLQKKSDFCASVQFCLGKFLCKRLSRAFEYTNRKDLWQGSKRQLVVSGGVACNQVLRSMIEFTAREEDCQTTFPPVKYCSDNGVMIAWNGVEKWRRKQDIVPWDQVFQVEVSSRVPFGQDISTEVEACQIPNPKINFKQLF